MTAATMMHQSATTTNNNNNMRAFSTSPDASRLSPSMHPGSSVITLPRLRIPKESDVGIEPLPHRWSASSHKDEVHRAAVAMDSTPQLPLDGHQRPQLSKSLSPLQFVNRSPSSPAAFVSKIDGEPKFGLAHLLEAAQHCHSLTPSEPHNQTKKRALSNAISSSNQNQVQLPVDPMAVTNSRLHSIDYLIHNAPVEEDRPIKRLRPDLSLDINVSFNYMGMPQAPSQQFLPPAHPLPHTSSGYDAMTSVFLEASPVHLRAMPTPASARGSPADAQPDGKSVWEAVLVTGNFPEDVCLSENPSCCSKASDSASNPVKQGRWTNDEKQFAENLIQRVRHGEVSLPPNMSLRKFIADSLQCKAMRVSKKFRSLSTCQSPDTSGEERQFNPLSLQSIMNQDSSVDTYVDEMDQDQYSPKRGSKTLKRSDYSQHGTVRSGRWSVEEENYAKAMIEAFKSGYLPLHGNVSLRKFLSEVLVCHPMRISKKFVGYVRKYHWYRIAAGKCDPEAKRLSLENLCQLEREFWASMQQNHEWASIQQDNRH